MNGLLITDVLVWNLLDPYITPEYFAENLCEDLGLSDLQMQQVCFAGILCALSPIHRDDYR